MSGFQKEAGSLNWFHRFRVCVGYIAGLAVGSRHSGFERRV